MDQKKLAAVLAKHKSWLNGDVGGECADLSGVDFSDWDLRGMDLSYVDLRFANLSRANLRYSNLSYAKLSSADLSCADLSSSNLVGVDLPEVICEADLPGRILAAIGSEGGQLNMESWHTCATTHCLGGWATTLHAQGKVLESRLGTNAAAALIFNACVGAIPDFYSDEVTAQKWLEEKAQSSISE